MSVSSTFLVQSGQLNRLKGNAIWREAAECKTPPDRSWQSLKNRFQTQIVPNIHKYKLLKEEHRNLILRNWDKTSSRTGDQDDESIASTSGAGQDPYLCFLRDLEQKQKQVRRRSRTDSRESPESDGTSSSTSSAGDQRCKYTSAEDDAIICYILKRIGWSKRTGDLIRLRGMQFWDAMCKDTKNERSSQSLRERFLKRILPNLNNLLPDQPGKAAAILKHAASSKSL